MKSNNVNLVLAAAFAGLIGGTTARLNAQPTTGHSETSASSSAIAGVMAASDHKDLPKHACKGQNDCKGQGGGDKQHAGKNECKGQGGGDAKHAGKNACKGQGACATDGSKPSN